MRGDELDGSFVSELPLTFAIAFLLFPLHKPDRYQLHLVSGQKEYYNLA